MDSDSLSPLRRLVRSTAYRELPKISRSTSSESYLHKPFPSENLFDKNIWAYTLEYTPSSVQKNKQFIKKEIVELLYDYSEKFEPNTTLPFVKGGYNRDVLASEFYMEDRDDVKQGDLLDPEAYYADGDIDIQFASLEDQWGFVKYLEQSFDIYSMERVSIDKYHDHSVYRMVVCTKYYPQVPTIYVDIDLIVPLFKYKSDNYIIDVNTLIKYSPDFYMSTMGWEYMDKIFDAIRDRTATLYLKNFKEFADYYKESNIYGTDLKSNIFNYLRYLLSAIKKVVKMMNREWKFVNAPFTVEDGIIKLNDSNSTCFRSAMDLCSALSFDGDEPVYINTQSGEKTLIIVKE